jgi:phosphatidylglycerophosphate synthase
MRIFLYDDKELVLNKVITKANIATFSGIIFFIIYGAMFLSQKFEAAIPLVFLAGAFIDTFDGRLARKYGHSLIGKFLDVFSNRLMTALLLANMYYLQKEDMVMLMIIFILMSEIGITISSVIMHRSKNKKLYNTIHTADKARLIIYAILGEIFLIQNYWLAYSHSIPSTEVILAYMLFLGIVFLVFVEGSIKLTSAPRS